MQTGIVRLDAKGLLHDLPGLIHSTGGNCNDGKLRQRIYAIGSALDRALVFRDHLVDGAAGSAAASAMRVFGHTTIAGQ